MSVGCVVRPRHVQWESVPPEERVNERARSWGPHDIGGSTNSTDEDRSMALWSVRYRGQRGGYRACTRSTVWRASDDATRRMPTWIRRINLVMLGDCAMNTERHGMRFAWQIRDSQRALATLKSNP